MTPNILLIVADQLRYDGLGCSGNRAAQTPHLDRLAEDGVFFTQAYSHIPICSPARQSFLNGRRPEAFGGHWNYDFGPRVGTLSVDDYAWPRELKKLGYRSVYLGKWGVHPQADPTLFGYDEYVVNSAHERFVAQKYPGLRYAGGYFGERDPLPLEDTATHFIARQAIDRIQALSVQGVPWHVRLDFSAPHLPCRPADRFADLYRAQDMPPWGSFAETFANKPYIQRQQLYSWGIEDFTWEDFAPVVARYFGMISQLDDAVGQVLQAVSQCGLENDTIVIFTADHGDLCGAHRMMDKHNVLYDDVVRVPLIIRWPGKLAGAVRMQEFIYNLLDVPPTLLSWLGVASDAQWHGRSFAPLLAQTGETPEAWRSAVVATYHGQQFGLNTQRMIRTKQWKYIWNATDVDELYDLRADPHELENRIDDQALAEVIQGLRRQLYTELQSQGDCQVDNEWVRRQLLDGRKLSRQGPLSFEGRRE